MNKATRQLCAAVQASLTGGRVRLPEGGAILWDAFRRLNLTRTYGMAGPDPIQPLQIEAFCRIMRLPLESRHFDILMAMDRAWLDHANERAKAGSQGGPRLPQRSSQPLTAALFDTMFS